MGKRGTEVKKQVMESVQRKLKKESASKARSGFTLVELIVVLALIGLLAAVSAGGMLGYTMYSTYKRNNENAKTLFSAAQSAITYYKASGRLDGLRKSMETLPDHTPTFVPQDAYADVDASAGDGARMDYSTISYLKMSSDDYAAIEAEVKAGKQNLDDASVPDSVPEETKLLFDLLSNYVTDVGIYNASICVEFDAQDGVVSGVLYSDKGQKFSYGEGTDTMDISRRDASYRRRVGLGYYNTELSEQAPQEEVKDLKVKKARMVNAESLDVQWFLDKKYQYMKSAQSYKIELYEDEGTKCLAEIILNKDDVLSVTREGGNHPSVEAESVKLFNSDPSSDDGVALKLTSEGVLEASGASDSSEADQKSGIKFHAYLVQDDSKDDFGSGIALSLDVMDSYAAEAMKSTEADADPQAELMKTYSGRRLSYEKDGTHYGLSLDGSAKVSAKVYVLAREEDPGQQTAAENLFFADGKSESGNAEYEIANARHLYNVSLFEQAAGSSTASTTYKIVNDFAWGGPDGLLAQTGLEENAAEGEVSPTATGAQTTAKYYSEQNPYGYTEAAEGERTIYPAFPGIAVLNANSKLVGTATEEEMKAAQGEEEDEKKEGEDDGEAEASVTDLRWTIDYLTLQPEQGATGADDATGLVRVNKGTIQALRLQNVDVRGIDTAHGFAGKNVGAFCGLNDGGLANVETVSGYVAGGENVGGIFGSFGEGASTETVSGLKNGAEVSGLGNVGGIVGLLNEGTLSSAENSGIVYGYPDGVALSETTGAAAEPKNIGGIVGYLDGATVKNCISNPMPQSADGSVTALTAEEVQKRLYGSYVGGIAGYMNGSALLVGCGTDGGYVLGKNFVGGIVGLSAGGSLTPNGKSNNATVVGRRFIGGIVGANGSVSEEAASLDAVKYTDVTGSGATISGWTNNGVVIGAGDSVSAPEYIGGIAGVNAGTIADSTTSMPDVSQSELFLALGGGYADYVGGIAGCNRGSLTGTSNIEVTGNVTGRSYVGGIVGYNDGENDGGAISGYTTAGVSVAGESFVGGAVGLNTSVELLNGSLTWNAGTVSGNSYVGGYAGANIIEKPATVTIVDGTATVEATSALAGGLFGYNRVVDSLGGLFDRGETSGIVANMTDVAKTADLRAQALNVFAMDGDAINGDADSSGTMMIKDGTVSGSVTAGVFAGGVLGYNAAQTKLTINNCTGSAAVTANSALTDPALPTAKYGSDMAYSFSGGILGYVSANTTLENCKFVGGSDGSGGSVTANSATYIGGLAEVNEGTITGCSASNMSAGGSTQNYVGGIVGVNGYVDSDKPATIRNSTASGITGNDVAGGIAGVNEGLIEGCTPAQATAGLNSSLGGIVGENRRAGKIYMGNMSDDVTMNAPNAANVGGVAGVNYGTIDGMVDGVYSAQASVSVSLEYASAGALGGIAGQNMGTIKNIVYTGDITSGAGVAKPDASYGGIAGINAGEGIIELCKLGAAEITVSGSYVGGIAGRNRENAEIRRIDGNSDASTVTISTTGAQATGGIVGINEGRARVLEAYSGSGWTVTAAQTSGSVGGVIGTHTAMELNGLQNYAQVTLSGNEDSGSQEDVVIAATGSSAGGGAAGGIVGRVALDSENPASTVAIQGCVNYAAVTSDDADGKAGGILGEWASDAAGNISGCVNGVKDTSSETGKDIGDANATIKATSQAGAAGIVGSFSRINGQVTILSCTNFGVVDDPLGAGIAAVTGALPAQQTGGDGFAQVSSLVKIEDCANAGCIRGGGAGIAVYDSEKSGAVSLELNLCRNYGRPAEEVEDAENLFAGLAVNVSGGFDTNSERLAENKVSIENSIGVAQVKYPTVPMKDGLPDEEYKSEFRRVSQLFSKNSSDPNVYYYSAETMPDEGGGSLILPKVIKTAGLGSAVSYATGLYKSPLWDDAEAGRGDRSYLATPDEAGNASDPNSNEYKKDCRGNYNRFDPRMTSACLKLENGDTVDPGKTPPATNVKAANNGGYLEITWENKVPDEEKVQPDGEITVPDVQGGSDTASETESTQPQGKVYKTELQLRLYESKDDAQADAELSEEPVYTATFYGGVTSHTVRVSESWMNQYIKVTVTNYSYTGGRQTEDPNTYADIIKILPSLIDPEPVISLERNETTGNLVYMLKLANMDNYASQGDVELGFKVSVETVETAQEGEDGAESTETVAKSETETKISVNSLPLNLTEILGTAIGNETADVRLNFTKVQVRPPETGGQAAAEKAPSAMKSFKAVIPAASKLTNGFIPADGYSVKREGSVVTISLSGEPATYRTELLGSVEEGDYLLEDIVVAADQKQISSSTETGVVQLVIPDELQGELAHARIYPLEMTEGMPKFGYLVKDGVTMQGLEEYLQPGTQIATTDGTQIAATGGTQTAEDGTQIAAAGETQTMAAETAADESGTGENQEPRKILTSRKAKDGYIIERYGEGLYRVYYSALMTTGGSAYQNSVIRWNEESAPAPVSMGGGGPQIASTGGGGSGSDQTQTESESETETETEEETETEQTETEPQTQPQTQTEAPELLPPESAVLVPYWDMTVGKDDEGEDKALSEQEFLDGLTLTIGTVSNAGSYRMRAAFYAERANIGMDPDLSLRLTEVPAFDGQTEFDMSDPYIGGYMFRELPLSYAGKWLCVQFCSVSADGQLRSEWSGYQWLRLPRISLQAPEMKRTVETETDTVNIYTPVETEVEGEEPTFNLSGTETQPLQHVAYSWTQTIPKAGETPRAGQRAVGYLVELYRMLNNDADQATYDSPTATLNLMRGNASTEYSYYLERDFTEEEIALWLEQNPDKTREDMEKYKKVPVEQVIEADQTNPDRYERFRAELETDPNLRIYEIELDKKAIGDESCEVSYAQADEGGTLNPKKIEKLYPKLRIREHLNVTTKEVESVDYQIVLPDIEPMEGQKFLYTFNGVYCTHSLTVRQLLQSVYEKDPEADEAITADRRQGAYVLPENTALGQEKEPKLSSMLRLLTPGRKYDEFDVEKDNAEGYTFVPRKYKEQIIWYEGDIAEDVAAMQAAMQTDNPTDLATIGSEMVFSFDLDGNTVAETGTDVVPDTTLPDGDVQEILPDNGGDTGWTDDGIILDGGDVVVEPQEQPVIEPTQIPLEPQTQAPSETQIQAPTEPQTQAPTEPQTQAAAAPAQAGTEGLPAGTEAFSEVTMSLDAPTGETAGLEAPAGEVMQ